MIKLIKLQHSNYDEPDFIASDSKEARDLTQLDDPSQQQGYFLSPADEFAKKGEG